MLAAIVNDYLEAPGGPVFRVHWYKEETARLDWDIGLGFLQLAWMQVALIVTNTKAFIRCDGCQEYYQRQGNQPSAGRNNFCPRCGKGKRGAKRLWASKSRKLSK